MPFDPEGVRSIAQTYGDTVFVNLMDQLKLSDDCTSEIIDAAIETFHMSEVYASRKATFEKIASSKTFILSGNNITIDSCSLKTRTNAEIYEAYWFAHHPTATIDIPSLDDPERAFTDLNNLKITSTANHLTKAILCLIGH